MQHHPLIRTIYLYLFALAVFLIPAFCFADNPRVTSVTANPQVVDSDHMMALSWVITGSSSGSNLYFTCMQGVKITTPEGATIPCNAMYSTAFNVSGAIGFKLVNINGGTISLPVRVYPKDINGINYDAGAMDTTITVNAVSQLLTEFTATTTVNSATTLNATTTATFTWIGFYLDAVNFQFTCADGVKIFKSPELTPVPCGAIALKSNLPGSGSTAFVFVNSSLSEASVNVTILPMIATGVYQSYQGKSLYIDVAEKMTPRSVSLDYFTAPKTRISSGDPLIFSWKAVNAPGVNLQMFICNSTVDVKTSQSTTTEKLRCGTPAFDNILPVVSTITLYFTNNSASEQNVSISLLPQNDEGTYNASVSKQITVLVLPPGQSVPVPIINPIGGTDTGIKTVRTIIFTQYLIKASRASQVKALQQFLAQDKTLYPEGTITGYFGDLTLKALQKFQCKYNIVCSGTPSSTGYGATGPKTRAKLNSLENF